MRVWLLIAVLIALGGMPSVSADPFVCVHVRNPNPPPWVEYGECPTDNPNCPYVTVYGEEVFRACVGGE